MQFTPQQLSGGPKFSSKVKIGNWAEDRARVEVRPQPHTPPSLHDWRCTHWPARVRTTDRPLAMPLSPLLQTELKDFELRKSRGELVTTSKAKQRAIALQTVRCAPTLPARPLFHRLTGYYARASLGWV